VKPVMHASAPSAAQSHARSLEHAHPGDLQAKRHIKRTGDNPGGIITAESPLHYSNVQLVDPVTKAPVRATWRFLEDGSKVCSSGGSRLCRAQSW
jgi:Ribosomal proteins 50S L24/mitochondrial 39S L24